MPSRPPTVSRRHALFGAAALAALLTAAGCASPPPPPDLDDLSTALDAARADSRLASEVAATTRGKAGDVLTVIAAQRSAHADALAEEIVRLTGREAPPTSTTVTTTTSAAAVPAPTVDDVIDALRTSGDSAAQAAGALSGYRAGLLASIAASCTTAHTVALAGAGDPQ